MRRTIFDAEHEALRAVVREFLDREVRPRHEDFIAAHAISRDVWLEAGKQGLLGLQVPEEFGGGGVADDYRYTAVLAEELSAVSAAFSSCLGIHADVNAPYLTELTTAGQKQRWLPGFCSGELVTAIAMTEPGGGSDLAALKTTAVRDGDDWVINGSKTFITNGYSADLVIVATRTDPSLGCQGHHAVRHRDRHPRLHPGPQARQGRPGRVRHRRAVLRGRSGRRCRPDR